MTTPSAPKITVIDLHELAGVKGANGRVGVYKYLMGMGHSSGNYTQSGALAVALNYDLNSRK